MFSHGHAQAPRPWSCLAGGVGACRVLGTPSGAGAEDGDRLGGRGCAWDPRPREGVQRETRRPSPTPAPPQDSGGPGSCLLPSREGRRPLVAGEQVPHPKGDWAGCGLERPGPRADGAAQGLRPLPGDSPLSSVSGEAAPGGTSGTPALKDSPVLLGGPGRNPKTLCLQVLSPTRCLLQAVPQADPQGHCCLFYPTRVHPTPSGQPRPRGQPRGLSHCPSSVRPVGVGAPVSGAAPGWVGLTSQHSPGVTWAPPRLQEGPSASPAGGGSGRPGLWPQDPVSLPSRCLHPSSPCKQTARV